MERVPACGRPQSATSGVMLHRALLPALGDDDERRTAARPTPTRTLSPTTSSSWLARSSSPTPPRSARCGWVPPLSDFSRGRSTPRRRLHLRHRRRRLRVRGARRAPLAARPRYLVIDNDYSDAQFPRYDGAYAVPVQVTAAHEFNHVLQYVYDTYQDTWMLESTATWAEEKVFDDANDYRFYLSSWADRARRTAHVARRRRVAQLGRSQDVRLGDLEPLARKPLRRAGRAPSLGSLAEPTRSPAEASPLVPMTKRSADTAGRASRSSSCDFTASVAEWDAANSGIHEGPTFPADVEREAH